jgi:ParB/RepB/Spo0J family partition protein
MREKMEIETTDLPEMNPSIDTGESMKNAQITMMSLNKIKLARNSRLKISNEDLSGLMQSIKEVGLLQPIGVSKDKTGYAICYGNRRFMACSKLGLKKIPVILHKHKSDAEDDLKNLTENIQRRNISLVEAGRYVTLLRTQGLKTHEIAVRLGVTRGYVQMTIDAYNNVPERYRGDIETNVTKNSSTRKSSPGKIAISTVQKILTAKKSMGLSSAQEEYLYDKAKTDDKFKPEQVKMYSKRLLAGDKDPVKGQVATKYVGVNILISETEYERLYKKHVANGHFKGIAPLFKSILEGETHERVRIIKNY